MNISLMAPKRCLLVVALAAHAAAQDFDVEQVLSASAAGAMTVVGADLDGDGDLDVLSAALDGNVEWFENLGAGAFGQAQTIPSSCYPFTATTADLDGDGDLDVLTSYGPCAQVGWTENLTNGTGTVAWGPYRTIRPANYATSAHPADIDGDGVLDVVYTAWNTADIQWCRGLGLVGGTLAFSDPTPVGALSFPGNALSADLDADGDVDIVSSRAWGTGATCFWYENDGTGVFVEHLLADTGVDGAEDQAIEDLDGDGDPDLIFACKYSARVVWIENLGSGAFGPVRVIFDGASGGSAPFKVCAGDLDGDGDSDVVITFHDPGELVYVLNDGQGSFSGKVVFSSGHGAPRKTEIADVTGDGRPDLLAALGDEDRISWFENLGFPDCNANNVVDSIDIAAGLSTDCDSNGVLDECQLADDPNLDQNVNGILDSCECAIETFCIAAANSSGQPASMGGSGTASLSANDLTLSVSNAPPFQFGLFFYGADEDFTIFGDGAMCVSGPFARVLPVIATDGTGSASVLLNLYDDPFTVAPNIIAPFETWRFQFWYRDPLGGPAGFNLSDGLAVTFCP